MTVHRSLFGVNAIVSLSSHRSKTTSASISSASPPPLVVRVETKGGLHKELYECCMCSWDSS